MRNSKPILFLLSFLSVLLMTTENVYSMIDETEKTEIKKSMVRSGVCAKAKPKELIVIGESKLRENINFDDVTGTFFSGVKIGHIQSVHGSIVDDPYLRLREDMDKVVFTCSINALNGGEISNKVAVVKKVEKS